MALRYEIDEAVFKTPGGSSAQLQVAAGASITVKDLAGNNLTVYQAETGASTFSNPLTSDTGGRIEGWVQAPDFDLVVSGTGITTYTQYVRTSACPDVRSYGLNASASAATNSAALAAAVAALPTDGGLLAPLPDGLFDCSEDWEIDRPIGVRGSAVGTSNAVAGTVLRFPSGSGGLTLTSAAQKSRISDLYLLGQATGAGAGEGVNSKASRAIFDNVVAEAFGNGGWLFDTSVSGNANLTELRACRAASNFSHGFYTKGNDSNVVKHLGCDAVSNTGWGYRSETNQNLYLGCHSNGNTLGAYFDNGLSSMFLLPYSEGGTGDNATLSGTGTIWIGGPWAAPVITWTVTNGFLLEGGKSGDQTGRNTTYQHYGFFEIYRAAAQLTSTAFRIFNASEANPRFTLLGNGRFQIGDGTNAPDVDVQRSAANVLQLGTGDAFHVGAATDAGGNYVQFFEQTADPAAGATNTARLFAKDNGSGKTQLVVRFPSGVVQVIATEP